MNDARPKKAHPSRDRLVLDHIAIGARTLKEGAAYSRDRLDIDMPLGGAHPRMGTHNLLMSLGPNSFLEVIAIDPDAPQPAHARWYGLDSFNEAPRLVTWILGTRSIASGLDAMGSFAGEAVEVTKGDLRWLISVPQRWVSAILRGISHAFAAA